MPIRSMTGFARVARPTACGELTVSLKSVNHRGLDIILHMPMEFDSVEPAIRAALRRTVCRGHIQVQVFYKRNTAAAMLLAINEPLLQAWANTFRELADRFQLDSKPDLNQALRLPGMIEPRAAVVSTGTENALADASSVETILLAAVTSALAELDQFRLREGAAIEIEIRSRAASIRQLVARMEDIRSRALPHFQTRLRERLHELLGGGQLDPSRIVQEAALLAERSDISEELVRLKTHADQADSLLAAEGETGKKLDFLLQEMNRETNTILSKTGGLGEQGLTLTDLGLAAKAEIDRIREQSLNIE